MIKKDKPAILALSLRVKYNLAILSFSLLARNGYKYRVANSEMEFSSRVFFQGQTKSRVFQGLPGFPGFVGHPDIFKTLL